MANIQINAEANGLITLATAGKYCDRNIEINVSVPGGISAIPSYWKTYLDSKTTEINSALETAGENNSAFLWYTDAHWTTNYGTSPVLLKYLSKYTGIKKTFFGGDIATEKSGEINALTAWRKLVEDIPNHHSVIGNHDNQTSELTPAEDRADFFITPERTGDMVRGTHATNGKMYYYIDNHIEKTRYICLSTGRMWTNADEVEWCMEVLLNTPKNWHIVIISHLWLNNDYTNGGVIATPEDYTQGYLDMFDAYNYRLSGNESFTGKAYDFASAKAKIEFIIGGHVHLDYDFTTAMGIPVILTECDAWQERDDDSSAKQGTTTESCVYAIVADYSAKSVRVINVGRGDTRSLTIPDVATYTNWAKLAYSGADMTIYNDGKGYKDDVRVGSSGTESEATGWDSTGYIPVRIGDVVRFKNCTVYNLSGNTGTNRMHFAFFDESFAYVTESSPYDVDNVPSESWHPVHGDNGDLIQVMIPSAYKSTIRYMRITMDDINDNSIIAINEEID